MNGAGVAPPLAQPLGGGLVMRTAAGEEDVHRVAAFNAAIHGSGVGPLTVDLYLNHPDTTLQDLVYVEDEAGGQVISSLCLIPWRLRLGSVTFLSAEQGIVGTTEEYRRRGLIRAQFAYFQQRMRAHGCLLSHIQGIAYYYRQFGYQYALPLEGGLRLELSQALAPLGPEHHLRLATAADIPDLVRLYDAAAAELALSANRTPAIWSYLMAPLAGSEMAAETWLVERGERPTGYFRLPAYHFGDELTVNEVSQLDLPGALAVLDHLKRLSVERSAPGIRLNLPAGCTLMRVARGLGARDLSTYAWQIHIPDYSALLRALAPVLETRLAASPCAGLTHELRLSLYRETIALQIVEGRIAEVVSLGMAGPGALNCPPLAFVPLVLGDRTVEELRPAYPDLSVEGRWRVLIDTLFPKAAAFLYTVY